MEGKLDLFRWDTCQITFTHVTATSQASGHLYLLICLLNRSLSFFSNFIFQVSVELSIYSMCLLILTFQFNPLVRLLQYSILLKPLLQSERRCLLNACLPSHQPINSIRPRITHGLITDMTPNPSQKPIHYGFSVNINTCWINPQWKMFAWVLKPLFFRGT